MKSVSRSLALLVAAVALATRPSASPGRMEPATSAGKKNIVETAVAAGNFKTLVSLVQQAGLADTLATGGTFTVFAPTDAAFAKVPKSTLASSPRTRTSSRQSSSTTSPRASFVRSGW